MKRLMSLLIVSLVLSLTINVLAQVAPAPTIMNFQGRLTKPDGTLVSSGSYSIRFSLWTALTGGTEKWSQTVNPVTVRNGTIAVLLSGFPAGTFNSNLWLEIRIGSDAALSPRTPLVTVPYAFKSDLALAVPDGSITGAQIAQGTLTIDKFAPGVFNPLVWLLNGNSGVTNGYLGTTDNNPLVFKVNNRRVMRYSYAENTATAGQEYRSMNILGGSELNSIAAGIVGATIAGGGSDYFSGTDYPNSVTANFGTVSGGINNSAGNYATVGGGFTNNASGYAATIAGGYTNIANGDDATVGGGSLNTASSGATVAGGVHNTAYSLYGTVGGGDRNTARGYATVGGGSLNTAGGSGYETVGGGLMNTASNLYASVGGGLSNTASGSYATIPGGNVNTAAGFGSFAAGRRAKANHDGAFVWGDNTNADFASTLANQFNIRASGGVRIFSNSTATTGVILAPGGGSWSSASDRNLKANFQPVDPLDVLERLLSVPVTTWNYKASSDIRHMGIMAQDFYAAFDGLGLDDKHIDSVDADGVALAAIQGLYRRVISVEADNLALKAKNAELEAKLALLAATVGELQKRIKSR